MGMAEQIKELVTIPQALQMYGFDEGRHRRIPCPIHGGKDSNFAYTDSVYHCWTCGAKGDVISFVMELHGIGFGQAITRLNADFNLGLTNERPTAKSIAMARKKAQERQAELARRTLRKKAYLYICEKHAEAMRNGENTDDLERWLDDNIGMAVTR